ncbi:MAG: hypothetical protein HZC26_01255, partial [Candidatus Magasanikbacteria bacterium]|nr:hypothetical protein [Candidatus Magasanikbacteria bacterium]
NKTLVKLILSAVFVNFSNLISQLFIDAAHVFTLTFASAISATAGGNLINMFHFEKIYAITTGKNDVGVGGESFNLMGRTLIASIVAMLFALLAILVMGAYAIMMLLRMTVLWVLIILSPLAFLFLALPQTANRYGEWWKEFSNYVVLAPTISFFMWLAFATAGSGTLGTDLGITDSMMQDGKIDSVGALTLSTVTTWENMANFLVAIGLLFVGLQEVQKLNVAGGSVASKAKDFFGKVATIATGYAAGRWLAGKAAAGAKAGVGLAWKGTKTAAWYGVRGEHFVNWGKRQVAGFHAWRKDTGSRPKVRYDSEGKAVGWERDQYGRVVMEKHKMGAVQKWFSERAMADADSRKKLKRTEDFSKTQEELLQKRTSAIPEYLLMNKDLFGGGEDWARFRMGELEEEKARSDAKTQEFSTQGKKAVGSNLREKYRGGKLVDESEKGTVTEQIVKHKIEVERGEADLAVDLAEGREKFLGTDKYREKAEQEVALKIRAEKAKTEEERIRETAKGSVLADEAKWRVGGIGLLKALDLAEQGKKAAEEFVKGIKEGHLAKEFKKSAKAMADTLREWGEANKTRGSTDIQDLENRIKQLGASNPFIEAMRQTAKTAEATSEKTQAEIIGVDISEDIVKNIPRGGALPSTVISTLVKQTMAEFEQFERQDASRAAAMRIFTSAAKRKAGKELDLEDRRSGLGSWMKVDSESWNDDVLGDMMVLIKAKTEGKLTNQMEIDQADSMQDLLNRSGFKYSQDTTSGNWRLDKGYDRDFSAMMQNMAATGGDTEAVLAHLKISRIQEARMKDGKTKDEIDYWKIAAEQGVEDILTKSYAESQDYIQVAAKEFKKNALANGHYESGLNQEYDAVKRIYRFNTASDAESGMIT